MAAWSMTPGFPPREKGQIIFPGFVVLLTIVLVIIAACILWSWKKQKKRRVPYFQVAPSLTLPPPRQRAKNIYDFLPRQQAELGRHQLGGFSTESLLSRASDSPEPEAVRASGSLQMQRVSVHAVEYTVGIYDNGTVPQMCGHLASSAHDGCVRTSRTNPSISSKESNDYVNIPTAEDTSEMLTCTKSTPENHLGLPSARQLEFAEGGQAGCGNATEHTGLWAPGPKCSDPLSDGDDSSQTSNDYVNMTGLDLEDIQENRRVAFQGCRDYENVPSVDTNGSQPQTLEEVTLSTTDHGEPVWRTGYHLAFQPSAWSEDSAMVHGEDESSEDSSDYENVLAAESEGRDWKQGPGTRHPSDEGPPGDLAGKLCEVVYPAASLATETSGEDA
ncbi:Lymphocyte transmembrane adapter 1 [Apodemus speciosus]|uniref:Lymphocyte transmembrane adapter 1 n=1 Tax=Apodemus speciosus TaxID=105296 RepID=A0ABQ0EF44_APOSI